MFSCKRRIYFSASIVWFGSGCETSRSYLCGRSNDFRRFAAALTLANAQKTVEESIGAEMTGFFDKVAQAMRAQRNCPRANLSGIGNAVVAKAPVGNMPFLNPEMPRLTMRILPNTSNKQLYAVKIPYIGINLRALYARVRAETAYRGHLIANDLCEVSIEGNVAPIRDAKVNVAGMVAIRRNTTRHEREQQCSGSATGFHRPHHCGNTQPSLTRKRLRGRRPNMFYRSPQVSQDKSERKGPIALTASAGRCFPHPPSLIRLFSPAVSGYMPSGTPTPDGEAVAETDICERAVETLHSLMGRLGKGYGRRRPCLADAEHKVERVYDRSIPMWVLRRSFYGAPTTSLNMQSAHSHARRSELGIGLAFVRRLVGARGGGKVGFRLSGQGSELAVRFAMAGFLARN
jgi:hypothetical protein